MSELNPNYDDPIVNAIHEYRHRVLAKFNNDFAAYTEYLKAHPIPGARYVRLQAEKDPDAPSPMRYSTPTDTGVLRACESAD